MPLSLYQKNCLTDLRVKEQTNGLCFLSLGTGAGYFSQYDAYRKITYTEITTYFSGALLLNPSSRKNGTEGGFYQTSDIVIVASRDNRVLAEKKDTKIIYDGIKFRVTNVADCEDTQEIVISASRLE